MNDNQTLVIFSLAFLIIGGIFGGLVFSKTTVIETDLPIITEKLVMSNCSVSPDFVLTQSDFEARAEENYAEELFLESIDSRDFKKAVFEALVNYGETIDSYKDIKSIKYEYDVDNNEIEVTKLKVYYFIDADEDETEKALLEDFLIEIDNLDFDELDESEINEDYLDNLLVNKVY